MDLHNIFIQAHRGFAYLELLLVAVFIVALFVSMMAQAGKISKLLRKSTFFVMIFFHIQLLVGLTMLFFTSSFMSAVNQIGMVGLMSNPESRFSYIEHPFSMLITAILMTIINKKVKTAETISGGIRFLAILALVLFFYAIPFDKLFG
ncbi:MAG: hypothetical protein LBE36_11695 [Flavobacteriaceae bacterium]|jgi:hypothetical protein|nr:hypothetical protein [Flavobacteriaceae bacterium]